jgi:cell division protein FtsB
MDTAYQILVIILSAALALFLVLSIVVASQIIRLLRTVQRIAEKAETVIETAEHVGNIFQNVSGPLGVMRMVKNIVDAVHNNKKHKRGK